MQSLNAAASDRISIVLPNMVLSAGLLHNLYTIHSASCPILSMRLNMSSSSTMFKDAIMLILIDANMRKKGCLSKL